MAIEIIDLPMKNWDFTRGSVSMGLTFPITYRKAFDAALQVCSLNSTCGGRCRVNLGCEWRDVNLTYGQFKILLTVM